MIFEEPYEELQRETQHFRHRHRPDRRAHRHDVMQDETLAVAARLEIFVQGGVGGDLPFDQVALGFFIEAQNVAQHAPEPRRQQIAALGEQAVEVVAVVFQTGVRVGDRKTHFASV